MKILTENYSHLKQEEHTDKNDKNMSYVWQIKTLNFRVISSSK